MTSVVACLFVSPLALFLILGWIDRCILGRQASLAGKFQRQQVQQILFCNVSLPQMTNPECSVPHTSTHHVSFVMNPFSNDSFQYISFYHAKKAYLLLQANFDHYWKTNTLQKMDVCFADNVFNESCHPPSIC